MKRLTLLLASLLLIANGLAYHVRKGKHEITPWDWAQYLDFADRHFKPHRQWRGAVPPRADIVSSRQ